MSVTSVTVPAPAKINLYLHVTGRRSDGYHLLDSLIVFAGIGDTLSAEPVALSGAADPATAISLTCDGPFGPALGAAEDNLVLKAARLLAARTGAVKGAKLTLTKRLPVASGIGGGSADAAAALRSLTELWALDIADRELHEIAATLGADVPICLHGRPAFVGGVGEIIDPAPPLPRAALLLVNPGVGLATPSVFKSFKGPMSAPARFDAPPRNAAELAELLLIRRNDLTDAAIALVPEIGTALSALEGSSGARLARMSGSGSTCFALFDDLAVAEAAARALAIQHPGWWVHAAPLLGAEARR